MLAPSVPTVLAASQAEMEAATSLTVFAPPGRVQNNPGVAKFWICFTGTGTIATRASHNVTSITDNGTGDYTVTIATDFSSANWCCHVTCEDTSGTAPQPSVKSGGQAAGTVEVLCYTYNGGVADEASVYVSGFGDQ